MAETAKPLRLLAQDADDLAVISAGTGLGQAGLFWDGARHRPFASEGGHCDFAPHDALGVELWSWLSRKGHVSYERVLSGPGLVALFDFFRETGRGAPSAKVTQELAEDDPAAVIARHGLAETDALCAQVLEHLPAPELRQALVKELARVLAPEGQAALSAYWYAPFLQGLLQREGRHSGEIFYHRFERQELADLLEQRFTVERLTGQLVYVLLAHLRRHN